MGAGKVGSGDLFELVEGREPFHELLPLVESDVVLKGRVHRRVQCRQGYGGKEEDKGSSKRRALGREVEIRKWCCEKTGFGGRGVDEGGCVEPPQPPDGDLRSNGVSQLSGQVQGWLANERA